MSGPKEARPIFLSNAERQRRALEAARTEAEAAAERLDKARAAAPAAARGRQPTAPARDNVVELRRFVGEVEAAIKGIAGRTRLVQALSALDAADRGAVTGVQLGAPAAARRPVVNERAMRMQKLETMLANIPGDIGGLVAIGQAWSAETNVHRRERLHSELLNAIKAHQDGLVASGRAAVEVDALLGQVAGIQGRDAEALRGELRAAAAAGKLPEALRARARALDAADKKAHVDAVVHRVLDGHGADRGGFETAFEKPGKLMPLAGIPGAFALVLANQDGTLRFEPVREPGCAATDREIQDAYHAVVEQISASAANEGVDIHASRIDAREPPVREIALDDSGRRRGQQEELKKKQFGDRA